MAAVWSRRCACTRMRTTDAQGRRAPAYLLGVMLRACRVMSERAQITRDAPSRKGSLCRYALSRGPRNQRAVEVGEVRAEPSGKHSTAVSNESMMWYPLPAHGRRCSSLQNHGSIT